jgi:hypothetical protein
MANVVATIERTITLQEKLIPRRNSLAIRTLVLTFYKSSVLLRSE